MTQKEHPSISILKSEAIYPEETPSDIIRRKCRCWVSFCKENGWVGYPYNLSYLASIMGVKLFPVQEHIPEGAIIPFDGRFNILYRTDKIIERQRFTICHELTHLMFPDFIEGNTYGILPKRQCMNLEKLCDIGASELLIPYDDIKLDIDSEKLTLKRVFALHQKYQASLEAVCIKIIEITTKPISFLFLKEETTYNRKRYKVIYQLRNNESFKQYIPKGTYITNNSCVYTADFEPTEFKKPKELFIINKDFRSFYAEALLLESYNDSPDAVLMLHSRLP